MASVGAWSVPWVLYGCRGGVAGLLGSVWPPCGETGPLVLILPPWGHGQSPGPCTAAVGEWLDPWVPMDAVGAWPVPWFRMAAVKACPVPWAP